MTRPLLRILLIAALTLGAGAPVVAQGTGEGDPLMASLLQVEDLPAGFETLGPEEGSTFDIDSAAFTRLGGRRFVSQAWSSETSGVVFDFRMELPSPEAAAAYLDEAELTLSEADETGLVLETDDAPIGEHARHYEGVTRIDAERAITFDNYLFHVGPVAAKVFVASVDLPEDEARRLAELAAGRMAVFASPEVEPGVFEAASPGPSLSPGPPPPAATPAATGRLAALVSPTVAETCIPFASDVEGELAALSCTLEDDLVVYSALADAAALSAAFELVTEVMDRPDGAGSCADGPYTGTYAQGGATRGQVACWEPPGGGLVLFWTDESNLVLGAIHMGSDDHAELDAAWHALQLP
jgi:hypothetical protein